jgi:oligopeptide/dipeptide ABC transporter ATP-binding protein
MKNYFEIQNLKVLYRTYEGEKTTLDLEHLVLEKGKTFGLVGESGSGKSVLAQTILGILERPPGIIKEGKILFNGENLLSKSEREMRKIRGKKISMIFQDPMSTLNPVFTVGTQITRVIRQNQGVSKKEAIKRAIEKIELVKISDAEDIMSSYPHELSGGQRQRIIIAIALSCDAELLIADEPTRNLDVTIQAGILKLIAKLQKELKVSVLFIANNLGLVSATCDHLAILHKGRIVEMGTTKDVLHNPRHPYTRAYIEAILKDTKPRTHPDQIIKENGDLVNFVGCSNINLCPEGDEKCQQMMPQLKQLTETHFVACHHIQKNMETKRE